MSTDSGLNQIIQYGTRADRIAFTPNPASGSKILYIWYETDHTPDVWIWDGSAWVQINSGGGGSGNVNAGATLTNHALVLGQGSTDVAVLGSLGTSHQVLHGAAAGDPSFSAVDLASDVTGTLPAANLTANQKTETIGITVDGAGSVITTGVKGFFQVPFSGTITAVTVLSTDAAVTSGSIVIDIWKDVYANYPPTIADTITASDKPTISSGIKSQDSTLTGWTTSISANDVIGYNVDSVTSLLRVTLQLTVVRS